MILAFRKGYVAGKRFEEQEEEQISLESEAVSLERKVLEAAGLTIIACIYIYIAFILPRQRMFEPKTAAAAVQPAPDPIADELAVVAR